MNIRSSWLCLNIVEVEECGFIDDYGMVFGLNFLFEVFNVDIVLILIRTL